MIRAYLRSLLLIVALAGCGAPNPSALTGGAVSQVDSILPLEEEMRRFLAGGARAPDALAPVATSREELVQRFVSALEAGDTLALASLLLSRAEFAHLYYPSSKYAREPYQMSPALLWFIFGEKSHKGIGRALRRYGGRPLGYAGHSCDPEPSREGENRLWTRCVLHTTALHERPAPESGTLNTASPPPTNARLFGSIVERAGRFKFVSYTNPL